LAADPPFCPNDCSYYNTVHWLPGCSNSNFQCLKNGQLYGKALGTVFVSMYVPPNPLGEHASRSVGHRRGQMEKIKKNKRGYKNKSWNTGWHVTWGSCKLCMMEATISHSPSQNKKRTRSLSHSWI
jgi:hypothetical protein